MSHPSHLILMLDYEFFGNGFGEVICCVVEPTSRAMEIAERYGATLTLFVEVIEFQTMVREACRNKTSKLGSEAIVAQIQEANTRGHDVQLHIHPQWATAFLYSQQDRWLSTWIDNA